jgi:hypothetical protein
MRHGKAENRLIFLSNFSKVQIQYKFVVENVSYQQ